LDGGGDPHTGRHHGKAAVAYGRPVLTVLEWIIEAYVIILVLRALLSWFPISSGSPLQPVETVLVRATEPVLAPVRKLIPPIRMGGGGIDLSLIIVIVVLELVARLL